MSDKSNLKWGSDKTLLFLEIFKQYTTLWDITHENYLKRDKRREAFNDLAAELEGEGFGQIPIDNLRGKIKSIKDSYRIELNKVKKSLKNGAGPEDVRKPKLSWFEAANSFLGSVVNGGESVGMDYEDNGKPHSSGIQENNTSPNNRLKIHTSLSPRSRPSIFKPRPSRRQSLGRRVNPTSSANKPEATVMVDLDDEHEKYGRYIAAQLRSMPLRSVIILQNQINNLIAEERLNLIDSSSVTFEQYPSVSSLESLLDNADQEVSQANA